MNIPTNKEITINKKITPLMKMFVVEPVYDKTVAELEGFLLELVAQDKLAMDGSAFAKKK